MKKLPKSLHKYFWGDNLDELSFDTHVKYITQTLLNRGDLAAGSWLISMVGKKALLDNLDNYKLDDKSKNYWKLILS